MIIIITPETTSIPLRRNEPKLKVFLAGTIDNGQSNDWQSSVIWNLKYLNHSVDPDDESAGDIIIYNPRRSNWNSDATQKDIEEQIKWEQNKLDDSDLIIMYLDDNSKSPISLLELGLYGPSGKMIVFCTKKFYRYSNVKLTCDKYNIPLIELQNRKDVAEKIKNIYNEFIEIDN